MKNMKLLEEAVRPFMFFMRFMVRKKRKAPAPTGHPSARQSAQTPKMCRLWSVISNPFSRAISR